MPEEPNKSKTEPQMFNPQTIDEVITCLTQIIDWAKENNSRLGYFAALYRQVTRSVKEAVEAAAFEDNARMERLDVVFAKRYLEAFARYRAGEQVTASWMLSFDAAGKFTPVVLQHLMLGMNAHIGLDLGIAAAEAAGSGDIRALKNDFNKINEILTAQINGVQDRLAEVWPALKWLDKAGGTFDERFSGIGIAIARSMAWQVAQSLSELGSEDRPAKIRDVDERVNRMGKHILTQRFKLRLALLWIRFREPRSATRIIEILEK